jgi:hypothetical protein
MDVVDSNPIISKKESTSKTMWGNMEMKLKERI